MGLATGAKAEHVTYLPGFFRNYIITHDCQYGDEVMKEFCMVRR